MKLTALCLILRRLPYNLWDVGFLCEAEAMRSQGDNMEPHGKDQFIEEIDKELRKIDAMLKKVLSKTDALLKDSSDEIRGSEETHNHDGSAPSWAEAGDSEGLRD
jgi:hypothetical protein